MCMIRIEAWPPPDWTEVAITWDWIMESRSRNVADIFNWLHNQPGGRFHLHGYNGTKGFAFRFEDPMDATWFKINLPQ